MTHIPAAQFQNPPVRRVPGFLLRLWTSYRAAPAPLFALLVAGIFVFSAIFADWVSPYPPGRVSFLNSLEPPAWQDGGSIKHLLGTDQLGRDQLSRLIYGAQLSLMISAIGVVGAGVFGVFLGILAGYGPSWIGAIVMRTVDAFLSMPFILVVLAFIAAVGVSFQSIVIVMWLTNWPRYARLVRGEVLKVREADFVALARVAGVKPWRIAAVHILPNVMNSVIVLATIDVGRVIVLEATLSFLGLGIQPPDTSWGLMLADGQVFITHAWWLAAFPGLAILFTVLAFNLLGDWLRDRLDPRMGIN
ncbi:MAG TPA: ABC transporter permease [Xanthobacteraceae bacterium]|nr:ABC transporter permease [Xanthobacteraceae bacterium]